MARSEEDWELLPKQEVDNIKLEIERLKKNPFSSTKQGEDLLDGINNLNASINKLLKLFTDTQEDLAREYSENNPAESINTIKEQNEQIAQGLVAVADMVKEIKDKKPASPPDLVSTPPSNFDFDLSLNKQQGIPPAPQPQQQAQQRMPTNPNQQQQQQPLPSPTSMPSLFEEPKKSGGLFSRK